VSSQNQSPCSVKGIPVYSSIKPLDHYYVLLRDGSLAVVTGNWHVDYCIVGYVKYRPSGRPTQWSGRGGVFYERLVKTYGANTVREHTSWSTYVPFFDSHVPCIPLTQVDGLLDPLKRSMEALRKASDGLESTAVEVLLDVSVSTGVLPGITGSLLPGIHNPHYSDLDLVVYGLRESIHVVEYLASNKHTYMAFNGEKLNMWAKNAALSTGLSPRDILKFYRNWRRGVFRGKEYSFMYNDGVYRNVMLMPAFRSIGVARIVLDAYGGPMALNYPAQASILSYRLVESLTRIPYDIERLLSYEAVYMTGLYEGGRFEAEGLVQCSNHLETCRMILGTYEYKGFMRYYG